MMFGVSQVVSAGGAPSGLKEELYESVQRLLLCLDSLTNLLLAPGGVGEDDPQLRLLQHEVKMMLPAHTAFRLYYYYYIIL